ncbi:MAG: hypothetical protein GC165_12880 [Armatimonadetes bacterium]|nr:hypothetical protein [Armatimonadota bacterium]
MSDTSNQSPRLRQRKEPAIVHELPGAPKFVGRTEELEQLREFRKTPGGVFSLVGIGGAGKTAVLKRFLDETLESNTYDGILVWSFYDDPDTNAFLRAAVEYVSGQVSLDASGSGWFHALKQSLEDGARYLFVLDGLERVQRSFTDAQGIYGELEDALLRGFLLRLLSSSSQSQAILTSRFPVSDLDRWNRRGYDSLDIDQLDSSAAFHILRTVHGVSADDQVLQQITSQFGRHALTIDLLGAAISHFFNGDPTQVLAMKIEDSTDTSVARLAGVLNLYQSLLSQRELDLMSRLCVFRFGVTLESLEDIFLTNVAAAGSLAECSHSELEQVVMVLTRVHLCSREPSGKFSVHPAVRDHFYRLFRDTTEIHGAISDHLLSLSTRPGIGLPTEKESLDLLEELIHHAIRANRMADALEIYRYRMGGNEHLNVNLGEYTRTFRILSAFETCPDPSGMYYCLRAFGDFEEALKWRPQNRYIRIANGHLEALRDDANETTRRAARYLLGESGRVPDRMADFPISAAHLHLLANSLDDAEAAANNEAKVALYQDDKSRAELALAEIDRRRSHLSDARRRLDRAAEWVLRSGSHEHLCLLFLFRGRMDLDLGDHKSALSTLQEAQTITLESQFRLVGVEVAAEMCRALTAGGRLEEAQSLAESAGQAAAKMRYVYGEMMVIKAAVDLATITENKDAVRQSLMRLLELQKLVNDPLASRTELALKQVQN